LSGKSPIVRRNLKTHIVNGSKQDRAETLRDDRWSESIAGGSEGFVEQVKNELGLKVHNIARLPWWATISIGKMRF